LVVVSNQDSNRVNFHKRDPKTGALTLQRTTFESKTPVFAVFQAWYVKKKKYPYTQNQYTDT
jgi:6-phosphogluconolactonase (cycloisomerase 2 family)